MKLAAKIGKIAAKATTAIEESRTNFLSWSAAFLSLIVARILIENWIAGFQSRSGFFLFYEFTHNFLFFLIAYIIFLVAFQKILKVKFSKFSNILLFGFLIMLTPPIIDNIISQGKGFWSFYKFDSITGLIQRYFTFFGDKPEIGITYGVRAEVAVVTILMLIYSYIKFESKSKKLISAIKAISVAIASYTILFILGTFPSYVTIAINGLSKGFLKIKDFDVAQMFLTPVSIFSREISEITSVFNFKMSLVYVLLLTLIILWVLFIYQKAKFLAFLSNIRPPQIFYHAGLLALGTGLGLASQHISSTGFINLFNILCFLILIESVILAWLASVVINDLADKKIDQKTNPARPLIQNFFSDKDYAILGGVLFFFSILFSSIVNFKIALLLVVYQAIAWMYSVGPFRFKRFAFVSTFISAIASLMILFSGYIFVSPEQNLAGIPHSVIILLLIGYTFAIPMKDFKDIEGDKEDRVYTIPVIFGEYWGKIIVGSGIFLSFISSVIIINEPKLFWPAMIFGGLAFWTIIKMQKDSQKSLINYRNIFWWMIGTVSIYGLFLVGFVFF